MVQISLRPASRESPSSPAQSGTAARMGSAGAPSPAANAGRRVAGFLPILWTAVGLGSESMLIREHVGRGFEEEYLPVARAGAGTIGGGSGSSGGFGALRASNASG